MSNSSKYQMTINFNILNHLGINLYSNVPAVLSEIVANSWDADATKVDIDIEMEMAKLPSLTMGLVWTMLTSMIDTSWLDISVGKDRKIGKPRVDAMLWVVRVSESSHYFQLRISLGLKLLKGMKRMDLRCRLKQLKT